MDGEVTTGAGAGFDLVLGYPQWQGSRRHENLPRGARVTAEACARFGPLVEVPLSDAEGDAPGVKRWAAILEQFESARAILAERRPDRLLTAGGDCAVDIAAIDYLARRHPGLSVVWIDAHLDANTSATSPGGGFHGMAVAAILGHAPEPMRQRIGAPIGPSRFHYYGIRMGDAGELAFQAKHGLRPLDPGATFQGPVHIHFDLDALDPAEFPHIAYPEGTLAIDDALALVSRIAGQAELVGLTITEFAPADEAAAREGSKTIARICEAALQ